jgi:hypothetical protein
MTDLRDLLHAAADELPTDGLHADALAGRVRRRRAARTVTRSAVGVGAVGALAFGAAQLQSVPQAADSAAESADLGAPAEPTLEPQAGAAPGTCGWAVAAGVQDDGSTITTSTTTGAVRATVLPADTATADPTAGGTLDAAVMFGSDDEDPAKLTADGVTLFVTQDGVVVARRDVDGLDSTSVAQQSPWYVWADVPLEGCDRPDGAGPVGALDGDLAVWVLADVTRRGESTRLLGGGTPIRVEQGEVPGYCGERVDELTSDPSVELTGTAEIGAFVEEKFVAGERPLDVLMSSQPLDVVDPRSRAAGGLGGTRLLLTDAAGTVVSDSATPDTGSARGDVGDGLPIEGFGGWYDLPAVGQGGQMATDAVTCDGDPLPAGTYEAWGMRSLAPWDPDLAAGPALGSLGTITVP